MTELDSIPVFVKVAQLGSFTQAARVLGMPNTTVSAKVAQLERSLGVTLMQRTTRKLHLTETGQAYLERCIKALAELQTAESEIANVNGEIKGVLRVTASVDVGHSLLPTIVARFLEAHPQAEVDMIVTNRTVDLIGEGVDIAIRAGKLKDSTLVAKRFIEPKFSLFASKSYLKKYGIPTIKTLGEKFPFVRFLPFKGVGFDLTNGSQTVHLDPTGSVQADDLGAVRAMAILGHGIALLPSFIAEPDIDEGNLVDVLPDWSMTSSSFSIVYPPQRFVSPKVRAFIDIANAFFAKDCTEAKERSKNRKSKSASESRKGRA